MAHRIPTRPAYVAGYVDHPEFPGALIWQEEGVGHEEEERIYKLCSGQVLIMVLIYSAELVIPRAARLQE